MVNYITEPDLLAVANPRTTTPSGQQAVSFARSIHPTAVEADDPSVIQSPRAVIVQPGGYIYPRQGQAYPYSNQAFATTSG